MPPLLIGGLVLVGLYLIAKAKSGTPTTSGAVGLTALQGGPAATIASALSGLEAFAGLIPAGGLAGPGQTASQAASLNAGFAEETSGPPIQGGGGYAVNSSGVNVAYQNPDLLPPPTINPVPTSTAPLGGGITSLLGPTANPAPPPGLLSGSETTITDPSGQFFDLGDLS